MLRFGSVVRTLGFVLGCSLFGIVFTVLPGCEELGEPELPPVGTYRMTTLDYPFGGPVAVSVHGLVAWFRLDYRGPKPWVEIVMENRVDGELVGTETILRRQFGIDHVVERDGASWSVTRDAFSETGQLTALVLQDLPELLRDGRTTLSTVYISSPTRPQSAKVISKLIRVEAAHIAAEAVGRTTKSNESTQDVSDGDYSDSESELLWYRTQEVAVVDEASGEQKMRTHSSKAFLRFAAD